MFWKICNFNCGLSDVHHMIAFQLKADVPSNKTKWCLYRSFKDFNADMFNLDLQSNLTKLEYNNVNTMCNNFSMIFNSVADKHAPLKSKRCIDKYVP